MIRALGILKKSAALANAVSLLAVAVLCNARFPPGGGVTGPMGSNFETQYRVRSRYAFSDAVPFVP